MDIGDRIRMLREMSGLTQAQLADMLDKPRSYVNRFENNEFKNPTKSSIQAFADALKTSAGFIMYGESGDLKIEAPQKQEKKKHDPIIEEISQSLETMEREERRSLLQIVRSMTGHHPVNEKKRAS